MLVCQSCPTLCDPMDCSPPGSSVHGISQARIMEWVAISFSRGFSPGIELRSPALQADFLPSEPSGKPNNDSRKYEVKHCDMSSEGRVCSRDSSPRKQIITRAVYNHTYAPCQQWSLLLFSRSNSYPLSQ